MKKFALLGALIFVSSGLIAGQDRKDRRQIDRLCAALQEKVIQPQNPIKLVREYKSIDGCTFDYFFDRAGEVRFRLDRFRSKAAASFEQESLTERLTKASSQEHAPEYRYQDIDANGFWDSSSAYEDRAGPNNFLVVRRGKYLVVMFTAKFSMLRETEVLLRNMNFD